MSIVTYKRGDKTALTKNFTRDEFECQCKKCDAQMIDLELVDKLQSIRDALGVKLKVGGLRRHRHLLAFRGCYVPRGHPRRQGNLALHLSGCLSLDDVQ